jgi:hypothetical protein
LNVDVVTIVTTPLLIETTRSIVNWSPCLRAIVSGGETRTSHRPAAHAVVSVLTGVPEPADPPAGGRAPGNGRHAGDGGGRRARRRRT